MKFRLIHLLLLLILAGGLFIRVYRVDKILGFYFDQGRDALVIWDFWHKGKLFLIGPTTGIAGIFRGPFYYYLIAPFYLLGGGDPIWPAVFLAFTTIIASALTFYLGRRIHSLEAGLFALVMSSFSFNIMMASRWLSNPTPMLLLSMILVWMMVEIAEAGKIGGVWGWVVIALVLGLSLFHFGSSGELFYFPAIFVFGIWQIKKLPNRKIVAISCLLFLFTALPLLAFDIKHQGVLRANVKKFLVKDKSFRGVTKYILETRVRFYWDTFSNKIFNGRGLREIRLLLAIFFSFFIFLPRFLRNKGVKILILLILAPLIGFLFFQGNYGNVYDYYLTGYYLIFILLFAIILAEMWKYWPGKIIVIYFFYLFLMLNWEVNHYKITAGFDGPETVVFGNQKQAIEWIYKDADNKKFNVDVYVPPVIPYAYDYLFIWLGTTRYGYKPAEEQIELLYTLYEVDPPHPERLEAWLERQERIGIVEKEVKFGGITVQRRRRL